MVRAKQGGMRLGGAFGRPLLLWEGLEAALAGLQRWLLKRSKHVTAPEKSTVRETLACDDAGRLAAHPHELHHAGVPQAGQQRRLLRG